MKSYTVVQLFSLFILEGGDNIFIITRREFLALTTVIILYVNLDVLLQIIVGEKKMSSELLKKKFMKMIFDYS